MRYVGSNNLRSVFENVNAGSDGVRHEFRSARISGMALRFTTSYLEDSLAVFRYYKSLAERAMVQVTDEQLNAVLDGEMNSIAITVKHMAGNMRSRWTDFLTSDGEKPNRNRDTEFEDPAVHS